MAWNYRKRIKIAPGIHLNLSKGGVSTSVGPKGAKITFGKNGTYMNTSIPGTGLYSRQKIGGGTGSSSFVNKNSNNTGFGCLNLAISIICIFIGIIICVFTKQTILIIIGLSLFFVGIVFLCTAINVLTSKKEERIVESLSDATNIAEQENNFSQNVIQKEFAADNFQKEQKLIAIDISDEDRSFFMKFFDPLFVDALILLIQHGTASTSLIQRNLSIGYNRAATIMDQLEQAGVVEPNKGSFSRNLLIHNNDEWLILKSRLLVEYAKGKAAEKASQSGESGESGGAGAVILILRPAPYCPNTRSVYHICVANTSYSSVSENISSASETSGYHSEATLVLSEGIALMISRFAR